MGDSAHVKGHCESAFGRVADAFAAQLESARDVGGSVGVYLDGRPVVEIWGGSADPGRGAPWAEHTVTPIGSTSKALARFILSGLVRAVTGRTVGEFFADEVARPLDLDLHIGLPREMYDTVAPMIGPAQRQAIRSMLNPVWFRFALGVVNRRSASYKATFGGTSVSFDDAEELVRYDVEDASAGALGNGPSLARMFASLIGEVDGRRLISADLMNAARQPQASGRDVVLRVRTDWGLGFALPGGPMWPEVGVPGIFGHGGASGSLGFADPEHQLAFGYTPNLWAELSGWFSTPFRFQALAEAVFKCAGVRRWPRA